jgi:hypothetical protein
MRKLDATPPEAANRSVIRRLFAAISRYRPRVLTLVVLIVVAALIALANLNFERFWDLQANIGAKSYGWPLIWHRFVFLPWSGRTVGWYYSEIRLAGDIVIWLALLATSCGACERFLRRYRVRPRWSLRTMLVALGICGALFAWFAAARKRADLQDSLITEIRSRGYVRVERWGPKWLDLIGADRFRRHITSAEVFAGLDDDGHERLERILPALGRLPRLQYLEFFIERDHLPPGMADALAKTRQLRALSISLSVTPNNDNDRRIWQECLAAIGQMTELEHLRLYRMRVPGTSLASLAGLTNLKRLILEDSQIHDRDLPYITALPGLRSLRLGTSSITDAGLRELARMPMLEDLAINVDMVTPAGLESLAALKRLRTLRIDRRVRPLGFGDKALALDHGDGIRVPKSELDGFDRALKVLRHSRPGIVIDSVKSLLEGRLGPEADMISGDYDAQPDRQQPFSLPSSDRPWMTPVEKANFKAAGGWARFDAAGVSGRTVAF